MKCSFYRCSVLAVVIGVLLAALCPAQSLSPTDARKAVAIEAHAVLEALGHQQFAALSQYVSADKGVRFSPYASIDKDADVVLTRRDLRSPRKLETVRKWGAYDGSGQPIQLSFLAYFRKFVWDRDFARAKVGFNEASGKSNTANNASDVYPNDIVVEYYVAPPSDAEKAAQWSSLRLVFEKTGSDWFLVGIVHDQWTI